jgi:diaminohydroxyphosphoribosylaminopyrimidine deaminase / 5-amino-6-(5-phosphoribosylamino)uracil reductase
LNTHKIRFMNRAFELAQLGLGSVSPNPMVGCVIVHNNQIIGEGWHKKYGGPHAEVNAINSVENKSILSESTAYVSLEPCAHQGKTPPCADLLIEHKLKRVVISNKDPFPLVNGGGIKKLENENIEVETDLLDKKGREINKRFFTLIEKKRVHKWRSEEDAILVGTNTAEYDNPTLNVRDWEGRDPIRLVIDKQLKLDTGLNLFDGSIPTICYNSLQDGESENLIFKKVDDENLIEAILSDLYARKIQSLIVEGGSQLLNSFIEKNLWDEARIFSSKKIFVNGIEAPKIAGQLVSSEDLKGDRLQVYKKINS